MVLKMFELFEIKEFGPLTPFALLTFIEFWVLWSAALHLATAADQCIASLLVVFPCLREVGGEALVVALLEAGTDPA